MYPQVFTVNRLPLVSVWLLMLCMSSVEATPQSIVIRVSTTLDVNQFYNESFTNVQIFPNAPVAQYDAVLKTFKPIHTKLLVNTDIPSSSVGSSYQVRVLENTSTCTTLKFEQGEPEEESFLLNDTLLNVVIDGDVVNKGSVKQFDDFLSESDGFKYSDHALTLSFNQFSEVINSEDRVSKCQGKVSVGLELTL